MCLVIWLKPYEEKATKQTVLLETFIPLANSYYLHKEFQALWTELSVCNSIFCRLAKCTKKKKNDFPPEQMTNLRFKIFIKTMQKNYKDAIITSLPSVSWINIHQQVFLGKTLKSKHSHHNLSSHTLTPNRRNYTCVHFAQPRASHVFDKSKNHKKERKKIKEWSHLKVLTVNQSVLRGGNRSWGALKGREKKKGGRE